MAEAFAALLARHPQSAEALCALEGVPLTYGELAELCDRIGARLRRLGIDAGDVVAMALSGGPVAATAFLAVAAHAVAAPLNPAFRREEWRFYLEDLRPKALLVAPEGPEEAVAAARELAVPVLRLSPRGERAGDFDLAPEDGRPAAATTPVDPEIALILHTSGTTSRPKMVPLTRANLLSSAEHIAQSLALGPEDRGLVVMPLFHIHGLVAALLAPLYAGGTVTVAPGFDALRLLRWLAASGATWMTAVPTMYQALLARAERRPEVRDGLRLRLLRSSSAPLPPQVAAELERTFAVPAIEAYGMTEAAHQIASNPLPPGVRKPGSCGRPAGPRVALVDEAGRFTDGEGEVVISGPNLTPGYLRNPDANRESFFVAEGRRWFRTGDLARFDEDGYLHLVGRKKEIINRGGEKVAPLEVDHVLLEHPAVAQAVTFAMPHPKLGEEVAAAVVLRPGFEAGERELRAFAAERLASFKVPRRILFVEQIPKGPTGKLQRLGLARLLGLAP